MVRWSPSIRLPRPLTVRPTWHDVCVDVEPAVFDALATDPGRFTVDVSGGGEVLVGQLRPATIFDLQLSR